MDQFTSILQRYASDPSHRAALHADQLTVNPERPQGWPVVRDGIGMVLFLALGVFAIVNGFQFRSNPAGTGLVIIGMACLLYLAVMLLLLANSRSTFISFDLNSGKVTTKNLFRQRTLANLSTATGFTKRSSRPAGGISASWFPIRCVLTMTTRRGNRRVTLIGFWTEGAYDDFEPVLDAMLRRFSPSYPASWPSS